MVIMQTSQVICAAEHVKIAAFFDEPARKNLSMFSAKNTIAVTDSELWSAMQQETQRQDGHIELIPSENYTSHAVMKHECSVLTHKYAAGHPYPRYSGGCEYVELGEQLATERLQDRSGAEHANRQPTH